ncbi:Ground-like domain protein [Aphelenchoides besseyi]|nr:Ground-like domain protein [Aphelenchoides besseyi]
MLKLAVFCLIGASLSQAFLFPPAPSGGGCCAPAAPACIPAPSCGASGYSGASSYGSSYASYSAPAHSYSSGGYAPQAAPSYSAPVQSYSAPQPSYAGPIGGGSYAQAPAIGGQGGYASGPSNGYSQGGPALSLPISGQQGGYAQGDGQQGGGYQQGQQEGYQQGAGQIQGPEHQQHGGQQQGGSYAQSRGEAQPEVSAPVAPQAEYQEQVPASSSAAPVAAPVAPQGEEHAYEDIGSDHEQTESKGQNYEGASQSTAETATESRNGYNAKVKVHAAPSVNTTEDEKCNNEVMKKLLLELISEKPAESKRQIQKAIAAELGGRVDVVCSSQVFSYLVNTEKFCEVESKGVTCLAYSQI